MSGVSLSKTLMKFSIIISSSVFSLVIVYVLIILLVFFREQVYPQARNWGDQARASPLQSRSFKYLQWITGTDD